MRNRAAPRHICELSLTAIERLFGLLDLGLGGLFGGRFIGGIDDILADADQAAAHRQIVQDAGIIAHIGHGGRGLRQARQIGRAAHFDQARIGLHRGMQGERREHEAAALHRHGSWSHRCARCSGS